jgi:rhodanese-related sulfurtransferase
MKDLKNYVILDVRTKEEYMEGHFKDAILIPDYDIKDNIRIKMPDKHSPIFVYCRTGLRSEKACKIMIDLGYEKVYDFGGILNWPDGLINGWNAN